MITIGQARRILSEWHGGQGSAVYSVASTGKMICRSDAIGELERDLRTVERAAHTGSDKDGRCRRELTAVIVWLQLRGDAGYGDVPLGEWLNAWDDTPV